LPDTIDAEELTLFGTLYPENMFTLWVRIYGIGKATVGKATLNNNFCSIYSMTLGCFPYKILSALSAYLVSVGGGLHCLRAFLCIIALSHIYTAGTVNRCI